MSMLCVGILTISITHYEKEKNKEYFHYVEWPKDIPSLV